MYTYVLVHTSIFPKFWHSLILPCPLLDTWRYQAVQGSTRKSSTPGYRGTRLYKALYVHVLPCTCISRGTGLSGTAMYLIVPISLPCTALYRLVSRRGQGGMREHQNLGNMLVCTSTYVFILVHTDSYKSSKVCPGSYCYRVTYIHLPVCNSTNKYRLVHTCMYLYVLVCTSMYQYILGMYKDKPET